MNRSTRMFEIIQMLRGAARPLTAAAIATDLEVTKRTIYRDIATLQAMRIPIEGEAGIGYIMRPGFDLPPLMFAAEEVEAIVVGLALLRRTRDAGLERAARAAAAKIASVLPDDLKYPLPLHVSGWTNVPAAETDLAVIRRAIRDEEELRLKYLDLKGMPTERDVLPIAVIYYTDALILAAWCSLRQAFRHFRADRIQLCEPTGARFQGRGNKLRRDWEREVELP